MHSEEIIDGVLRALLKVYVGHFGIQGIAPKAADTFGCVRTRTCVCMLGEGGIEYIQSETWQADYCNY